MYENVVVNTSVTTFDFEGLFGHWPPEAVQKMIAETCDEGKVVRMLE